MLEVHLPVECVDLILSIRLSMDEMKGERTVRSQLTKAHVGEEFRGGSLDEDLHLMCFHVYEVNRLLSTRDDEREFLEIKP